MPTPHSETDAERAAATPNRDHIILRVMGCFFTAFGLLVAVGLFWPQSSEARIVSGSAAGLLVICGALAFWCGRRPR